MDLNVMDEAQGDGWALYQGDCVSVVSQMPDEFVDLAVYSPPFGDLFVYSESVADMGNSTDEEFVEHYGYLAEQLFRITRPGRLCAVHCSDLPTRKWKDGHIGLKDFSGQLIHAHQTAGWVYHSRVTVWKDPVVEMQRTKALGLLYKQLRKDSTKSRTGMPDYILLFRKPGDNPTPVTHTTESFPLDMWQEWASPVWMSIDQTNVLSRTEAREVNDERHVCPLQLDIIDRLVRMYSNPGETVLSPFAGIGSEGYQSILAKRRFLGVELKRSYFEQAKRNLADAEATASTPDLFG